MQFLKINKLLFVRLGKARSHKYISRKPDGKGGWIYAYSKKPGEGRNVINYNDMKEFGYEKAVGISKDIEKIRNSEVEISKIYNYHGDGIFEKTGSIKGIDYTKEEVDKIKNSRLLIHNHPSGISFSPKDVYFVIINNIKEMRAVGAISKNKTNYSIKSIKDILPKNIEKFIDSYDKSLKTIAEEMYKDFISGKITAREMNINYKSKVVIDFCNKNKENFKYEKYK